LILDKSGDGIINQDDKTILGYRDPSYRFSINNEFVYNNWNLNIFVNAVQGGRNYYLGNDNLYGWSIFNTESHFLWAFPSPVLDYWTPENTDAKYQRPGIRGSSGIRGDRFTSRSFIRLQNVRLSYNFKELRKYGIDNLRLHVSGENLITLTKWPGWDPETGTAITMGGRPVMRSYSFGMDMELMCIGTYFNREIKIVRQVIMKLFLFYRLLMMFRVD
jgi:TonB-dependent starch-binding outer membrane protein SusC